MASFVIEGGHKLSGEILPQGAKNEVLQVVCATLLTSEEVTITNIPNILDVNNLIQLLRDMGVKVSMKGVGEGFLGKMFSSARIGDACRTVGCPLWQSHDF